MPARGGQADPQGHGSAPRFTLHTFRSRRLMWLYRIVAPLAVPLWIASLVEQHWYWWPTTILAAVAFSYFGLSAWIKGSHD